MDVVESEWVRLQFSNAVGTTAGVHRKPSDRRQIVGLVARPVYCSRAARQANSGQSLSFPTSFNGGFGVAELRNLARPLSGTSQMRMVPSQKPAAKRLPSSLNTANRAARRSAKQRDPLPPFDIPEAHGAVGTRACQQASVLTKPRRSCGHLTRFEHGGLATSRHVPKDDVSRFGNTESRLPSGLKVVSKGPRFVPCQREDNLARLGVDYPHVALFSRAAIHLPSRT